MPALQVLRELLHDVRVTLAPLPKHLIAQGGCQPVELRRLLPLGASGHVPLRPLALGVFEARALQGNVEGAGEDLVLGGEDRLLFRVILNSRPNLIDILECEEVALARLGVYLVEVDLPWRLPELEVKLLRNGYE